MASKYWIKLYHEILEDPKMMMMSEHLFARCIKLFLLAGDYEKDGELPPIKHIAFRLRISEEEAETDLIELQNLDITGQENGAWRIRKWEKRQGKMSNAERQRRYRDSKQKEEYKQHGPADVTFTKRDCNETSNEGVTKRNAEEDIDKDIDKDSRTEDVRISQKDQIRSILEQRFSEKTKIPIPKPRTDKQKKSAGALWYAPLRQIAELCEWDEKRALYLVEKTIQNMRKDRLTISSPKSILNPAIALYGELKSERYKTGAA